MILLVVLAVAFAFFEGMRLLGWSLFPDWESALGAALAVMFLLTASAHWGKRRKDIVPMVPRSFSNPGLIVTITGILEILGALGLLIRPTSQAAAACLILLLVAMFPANWRAAQEGLQIDGHPANPMKFRLPMQMLFIACLLAVALR